MEFYKSVVGGKLTVYSAMIADPFDTCHVDLKIRQVMVDGTNGYRALSGSAGDALERAVPDVAGCKDPWEAGFERQGRARESP
jgi:hypothetical protein